MTYQNEWRPRFPVPPHTARYLVEGRPVLVEALRVRTMNFGQHWRTPGVVEVRYEVVLPGAYAVALLEQDWADWIEDYQRFPEPNDPLEQALRALGWPGPAQALADPVVAPLVLDFNAHELLLRWFDDGVPSIPGFVLNTVDEVRMVGTDVWLAGQARPELPDVSYAYQD
ncbi:hypothetical protein D7Y27_03350 [Corallococcus sp. AB004]|uniref:hypothetical protein n=1 Tax=Corallococcus TaxID=83461 RepID=UPI000EA24E8E|nr:MULTISPECIES: hypothetical protein [Corallococcus]RKI49454.1 hypothetical protein D7Y27_03350 [Corallococcus sp. AB004]NPC68818.1 hypothetical protein [Corallococcus exiguus]NPD23716.1 hypothetical protein [Corallococcus exiguus]NRD44669.1 hypothetical protein [Corallococcus exiguus]RKI03805.1 hypothetical protein D7Y04_02245 [Corallococcus sp. AB038B]